MMATHSISARTIAPLWLIALLILSVVGVSSVLFATAQGIGISPDSVAYVGVARNLLDGRGLSIPYGETVDAPLTHFPPLYPLLLASSAQSSRDVVHGARWLQALLFGLLTLTGGLLLRRYATPASGGFAAALLVTSPVMVSIAVMAWTEVFFLILTLMALWLLSVYLDKLDVRVLTGCALVMGCATLTRYSGIALVMAGCLALLWLSHASPAKKLRDVTGFALLSLLPLALWMMRNLAFAGNATNREMVFHPIGRIQLVQALDTVSGWWLVPAAAPTLFKVLLMGVTLLLLVFALLPPGAGLPGRAGAANLDTKLWGDFPQVAALFALTYMGFLTLSVTLIDANTPFDARILSPVYVTVLILVPVIYARIRAALRFGRRLQAMFSLTATVMLLLAAQRAGQIVIEYQQTGIGLNSLAWQNSEVAGVIRDLPTENLLYSNAPDAVYFLTGRQAKQIPKQWNAMTQQPNQNYAQELHIMQTTLDAEQGLLVYFSTLGRASAAQAAALQQQFGLAVLQHAGDGLILGRAASHQAAIH